MSDPDNTPHLPLATLDNSQSPHENTVPRLSTPSQQKFCEPCKAFLRGDRTKYFGRRKPYSTDFDTVYVHHLDATSFQGATELPCDICIRLQKVFNTHCEFYTGRPYSAGPTKYRIYPPRNRTSQQDTKPSSIYFWSDSYDVFPDLAPYESRPDLHYQHITSNTGDTEALSFLEKQYQRCRKQHPKCKHLAPYNDFMPTRAIFVGSAEQEAVRLCDRAEITPGASYSVLSHCWGNHQQQIMLMESTVEVLKKGIPWSSLPKTFQDAIIVTRRFQIQYIWIDSLCIFQDNIHDWAMEATRMRDVYSKADFCIAATAARSGDVGLFFNRDIQQLTPILIELAWSDIQHLPDRPMSSLYLFGFYTVTPDQVINRSSLNTRAWVAQERFLSPRVLHFTQALLFWECHMSFTNENHTISDTDPGFTDGALGPSALKRLVSDVRRPEPVTFQSDSNGPSLGTIKRMYLLWCSFLTHYTNCKLTKESDILVALVGIADEVGHAMNDCLVAGLWKARFVEEMCWRPKGEVYRPMVWRAPSWSWASSTGCIQTSASSWWFDVPCNMAAVKELDVSTKPSGEIEQGSVLLECRLIPVSIRYTGPSDKMAWCTLDKSRWPYLLEALIDEELIPDLREAFVLILDDPHAPFYQEDKEIDVQLLVLLQFGSITDGWSGLEGICIVDSNNQPDAFERIGFFEVNEEQAESVLAAYYQASVQDVLLV